MTEAFAGGGVPSSVARLRDLGYRFAYLDEVDGQRSLLGKIVRRWSSVARGRWIRRIELVPCTVPPARSHQLVVAVP
jgi:hypothetical protein